MHHDSVRRNPVVLGLLVLLGALGTFIAFMGFGILVQNLGCRCVALGTPLWAWHLAPVLILLAGMAVVDCAVFLALFPRLGFRGRVLTTIIAAAAIELAVVVGTSRSLTFLPNQQPLVPVTAAVVVVLALAVVALREVELRRRAVTP